MVKKSIKPYLNWPKLQRFASKKCSTVINYWCVVVIPENSLYICSDISTDG